MNEKKILYLSYDGMTDPLGQSQILPYLTGLTRAGYRFTIISFEKKERFEKQKSLIERMMAEAGIEWVPLSFTKKPPVLSKFYDVLKMRKKAFSLYRQRKFDMVHCRSYIAADIGLKLKKKFGVKFFFDMRGFWADEKRDGGAWKDSHPIFKRVYRYYKKKEKEYLQNADYIISLTEAGKKELTTWESYDSLVPIEVIPCCADMDHFTLTNEGQRAEGRKLLRIEENKFVLSYLGSVGAWYMLDEMLDFFVQLKQKYEQALFLFITHSDQNFIIQKAQQHGILQNDLVIIEASRKEVPVFIKASDINISFIKPVFSKISSSPTKLGEVLSSGIPVVVNAGVGDVEKIVKDTDAGVVIQSFTPQDYKTAIDKIHYLQTKDPASIRNNAEKIFSLERGIQLYKKAYKEIFS